MSQTRPRSDRSLRRRSGRWLALTVVAGLCGCASSGGGAGNPGMLDKALEMVGLAKPAPPPDLSVETLRAALQPKKIALRLHAGDSVNTDAAGRSLSVVAHVYKLRNATAMLQAPYGAFKDAASEKSALEGDVIEMREVVLTPGKKYEVIESMPPEANYLAVVALLRAPDPRRWKFVFETREAVRSGVTLGLHACALSVAEGDAVGVPMEVRRLAGVQCPAS